MHSTEIPWKELFERYEGAVGASIAWLAVGVVCAEVAVFTSSGGPERALRRWLRRILLLLTVAFGLTWAWHLRWIADDAFISFRYSQNFARGLGLVFNPGERVEGYTNFLWTFLLGVLASIGLSPVSTAVILSLACFAGVIVLSARLPALALDQAASDPSPLLSPAAVLVAANYTLASFATSGLETLFAALLSLLALWLCTRQRPLAGGVCGVCAAMAHPDHGLLYASLALALLLDRERRRGLLRFVLPFVALYLPYFLWRWQYYGDLFPNTYYAKSADRAYFSQGSVYLVASLVGSGVWAALPLFVYGVIRLRRNLIARYALISTPLFVYYVARVGGDFMLGRLLTPILPVCLVLAEAGARALLQTAGARQKLATLGLYLVALAAVPVQIIKPVEKIWHLADERTFYLLDTLQPLAMQSWYLKEGRDLKRHFTDNGLRPKLAISAIGIVSYFSELPILDLRGLTERTIAHEPVAQRGRPGHERDASGSYALAAGAQLSEAEVYPSPYSSLTKLELTNSPYYFTRFDPELWRKLSAIPEAHFVRFQHHLDAYRPPTADLDTFWCDAWFFETYYFSSNVDPKRLEALRRAALSVYPELSRVRDFVYAAPAAGSGWRRVRNFDFQEKSGDWYAHGEAFSNWPATSQTPAQQHVVGQVGGFLNSFVPKLGDNATGLLVSSPFAIEGDVIAFSIAGGRDAEPVRVSLVVDGVRHFSATGCKSEVLGRRAWDVSALRGRRAVLEIADYSGAGWGHVVVDEIGQYVRDAPPSD